MTSSGKMMSARLRNLLVGGALLLVAACGQPTAPAATPATLASPEAVSAYPSPATLEAYPGPLLDTGQITPQPPDTMPSPASGQAVVSGVLYSYTSERVVPGTVFYLTPAVGEDGRQMPGVLIGPDSAADIRGQTNDQGQFTLENVPPGNYFLIVWSPGTWVVAVTEAFGESPLLIELAADQQTALGIVPVGWP